MANPKEEYIANYLVLMQDMLNKESSNYPYTEEKFATLYADIVETFIKKISEVVSDISSSGSSQTLDLQLNSIFNIVLTDNCVLTLINPLIRTYVIKCNHHISSSYTLTFPNSRGVGSSVLGNTVYTLAAGSGSITVFYIFYDGTSYFISENPFTS